MPENSHTRTESRSEDPEQHLAEVYNELRRLASYRLAHERPGQTLQATELVNEAYLRLVKAGCSEWDDAQRFFKVVADAMRHVLIDHARRRRAAKRGSDPVRVEFEEFDLPVTVPPEELLALDEALERMALAYPDEALVVKLRYFVGMSQEQVSQVLGISRRTVNTRWAFARAWLFDAVESDLRGTN